MTTPIQSRTADLKHAVIYLRVSTAKQADKDQDPEGYSIPAQRDACRRTAASLDAVVIEEFIDRGESARSVDRPELQRMLARITQGDIHYLVVHKLDRLARSLADDVAINLAIKKAGVELVSASEKIDDTPSGKLLHGVMASIAEFYSSNLSAEATKGMHQKVKMGGTPSRAPIGYLNTRQLVEGREVRTVVTDPERAPLIQWAFEAYATGDYSIRHLAQALEDRGLKNRGTAKQPSKPLSWSRVQAILSSRYYVGFTNWRGVEYPGRHEPLVTPETFHKVQVALRAHDHVGQRHRVHNHYLKGKLFCALCGSRLCLTYSRGNGGRYFYFFCLGRQRGFGCRQQYNAADRVEDAIVRFYATIRLEPARVEAIRDLIYREFQRGQDAAKRQVAQADTRITRLERERLKLLEAYYDGGLSIELLKQEQDRITAETAQAERMAADATALFQEVGKPLDGALKLAGNCQLAYAQAGPQIRRMFNRVFFTALYIDGNEVTRAELAPAFAELLAEDLAQRLEQERENPAELSYWQGSNKDPLVGAAGFEPAASAV